VGGPATSNFVPDTRFDGELEDLEVQKKLADVSRALYLGFDNEQV
jgi:xylan 1,4-beta-xylosidase